jgi:glycerol dehydrogenase-like iron-containing ADH family enzyme
MCAAPKHNQFYKLAIKSLGAPRKYETIEDLHNEIIAYFEEFADKMKPKYTITGLTAWLGYSSRRDFYNQAERGQDFSHLIKNTINIICSNYEQNLHGMSPAGSIFALKNILSEEWKDKTEVTQTNIEQPLFPENK